MESIEKLRDGISIMSCAQHFTHEDTDRFNSIADEIEREIAELQHALNKAAGNWDKADALLREIVRCEDCRYYIDSELFYSPFCSFLNDRDTQPDGFCKWGVMKVDEMSGTLTAEQVRTAIFNGSSYASYDGAKYYADGIGMQAIADELNTRDNGSSRYAKLFGTPERAARTFEDFCDKCDKGECNDCPLDRLTDFCIGYDALLEWLKSEVER